MTDEAPEGNLGRRAGTPVEVSAPSSDGITKIIGWIAGGFTLLGGSAGALALIPRTVGAYQNPVIAALSVLLVAILLAGVAGAINFLILHGDSEKFLRRPRRWWSRVMYACLSIGCLLVVVSIGTCCRPERSTARSHYSLTIRRCSSVRSSGDRKVTSR